MFFSIDVFNASQHTPFVYFLIFSLLRDAVPWLCRNKEK